MNGVIGHKSALWGYTGYTGTPWASEIDLVSTMPQMQNKMLKIWPAVQRTATVLPISISSHDQL